MDFDYYNYSILSTPFFNLLWDFITNGLWPKLNKNRCSVSATHKVIKNFVVLWNMAPKRNIMINIGDGSEEMLIFKTDKLWARKKAL